MRTNVWGAPQGTAKHRFPQDFQLQMLAMVLKKLYNGAYAVRPQAVVQVRISPVQAGGAPTFRQLPHILFSKSIIPNGQKIARGISSVGKFRDRKRIDKADSIRPTACRTIRVDEMMRGSSTTSHLFSHCEGVVKKRASGQRMLSFLHVTSKLAAWVSVTRPI